MESNPNSLIPPLNPTTQPADEQDQPAPFALDAIFDAPQPAPAPTEDALPPLKLPPQGQQLSQPQPASPPPPDDDF